jgi:hypothetical protein
MSWGDACAETKCARCSRPRDVNDRYYQARQWFVQPTPDGLGWEL